MMPNVGINSIVDLFGAAPAEKGRLRNTAHKVALCMNMLRIRIAFKGLLI